MDHDRNAGGQKELKEQVIDAGLCTGCGACVHLCPYQAAYKDQIIVMDPCHGATGRCYVYCPVTPADLEAIRDDLYPQAEPTPELGVVKDFYITRAADPAVRQAGQHGGTVTALIALAIEAGLVDGAVLTGDQTSHLPESRLIRHPEEALLLGGSRFMVSPTVAAYHRAAGSDLKKIGVVATPCQTLALAKIRDQARRNGEPDRLGLVIGLFCGWALSWLKFKALLDRRIKDAAVLGMDIPPSRYQFMEIRTDRGLEQIELEDVWPCIREACRFCPDMTAEFSDLSVGSARLPEGWSEARSWNQVIVRSELGGEIMDLARRKAILEFREVPPGNLDRLKRAADKKKKAGLAALSGKGVFTDHLIRLYGRDSTRFRHEMDRITVFDGASLNV